MKVNVTIENEEGYVLETLTLLPALDTSFKDDEAFALDIRDTLEAKYGFEGPEDESEADEDEDEETNGDEDTDDAEPSSEPTKQALAETETIF
jgi:hypothetical protein